MNEDGSEQWVDVLPGDLIEEEEVLWAVLRRDVVKTAAGQCVHVQVLRLRDGYASFRLYPLARPATVSGRLSADDFETALGGKVVELEKYLS